MKKQKKMPAEITVKCNFIWPTPEKPSRIRLEVTSGRNGRDYPFPFAIQFPPDGNAAKKFHELYPENDVAGLGQTWLVCSPYVYLSIYREMLNY